MGLGLRGIAQLVERRSPKPKVVGSMPTAPAKEKPLLYRPCKDMEVIRKATNENITSSIRPTSKARMV